jgi:hypothetical protein
MSVIWQPRRSGRVSNVPPDFNPPAEDAGYAHVRELLRAVNMGEVPEVGIRKRFFVLSAKRTWYRRPQEGTTSDDPTVREDGSLG